MLTTSKEISELFETTIKEIIKIDINLEKGAKSVANWINVELPRLLREQNSDLSEIKAEPENLAHIIKLIDQGQISNTMAKTVFDESFLTGESPAEISSRLGLVQISDKNSLNLVVEEVLQENPKTIQDYLDGKNSALRFLVGQIMKKTKGNANPKMASEILETTLGTRR